MTNAEAHANVNNASLVLFDRVIAKRKARVAQVEGMTCSNKKILLWEANKMLQQAEEKKARFVKRIAWELENCRVH